jgi:integrase
MNRVVAEVIDETARFLGESDLAVFAQTNANAAFHFSRAFTLVVRSKKWSSAKSYKVLHATRNCMREIAFAKKLRFVHETRSDFDRALNRKHNGLEPNHPARVRLCAWIKVFREETTNHSSMSLRNIVSFLCKTCRALKLDLSLEWPSDTADRIVNNVEVLQTLCTGSNAKQKLTWLQTFVRCVLKSDKVLDAKRILPPKRKNFLDEKPDIGDLHRINAADLDKLYLESRRHSVQMELMFLLMVTTGMRVGGLVNILMDDVKEGEGKTLEKGRKWFRFVLVPRVQELMKRWLAEFRKSTDSKYVFPGRMREHLSTSFVRRMFSDVCKAAKLQGKQFHPHALRHSYAHMLLESDNSPEIVSKLLNHSSVATTEKFYIKENTLEVLRRANVPWLKEQPANKLPDFLQTISPEAQKIATDKRADLAQITDIIIPPL